MIITSLEKYKGLVYDETKINEAKADRANLNKLKAAIDDARKRQKAVCLKPYEEFEAKIKELTGMINVPVLEIDRQIKNYEAEQRQKKKDAFENFYKENAKDIIGLVSFDRFFVDKWTIASASEKAVQEAIRIIINRIERDLATIEDFGGELALNCKDVYIKTLDINMALAEKARIERLKAQLAEHEARAKQKQIAPVAHEKPKQEPVAEKVSDTAEPEKVWTVGFKVIDATRNQLLALRDFMQNNNINYEKVEL